jgi:hypothetical protein
MSTKISMQPDASNLNWDNRHKDGIMSSAIDSTQSGINVLFF